MASVLILGAHAPTLVGFRGSLIADLVLAGHEVFACSPDLNGHWADSIRQSGAKPIELACDRQSMDPRRDLRYAKSVAGLMREVKPDVVLAYTAKPVVWGLPAAKSAGVPKVAALICGLGYAFTGGPEPKRLFTRWVLSYLYRRALAKCDQIFFQNVDDKAEFARRGLLPRDCPITVVNGSGIDLDQFMVAPLPSSPNFLMIARLLRDKGVQEYASASMALKAQYPSVNFRLVGWLDPSPDCVSQADLDGWIAGGVEFLGRLTDVRPAISQASCYVLPSYREGTPRSVLEAMAMGRPIITTDAPGCRETVMDGKNGYLVPVKDIDALMRAMESLILRPERVAPMGAASRRLAQNKYDVHAVNISMMEPLDLSGRRCAG